jgi:hypothetical protein
VTEKRRMLGADKMGADGNGWWQRKGADSTDVSGQRRTTVDVGNQWRMAEECGRWRRIERRTAAEVGEYLTVEVGAGADGSGWQWMAAAE